MWRALPIWLNTWSAATHMKSGYMNSTTGRNRPSSASPPARPANAFSLMGVPSTRPGNASASPFVAPFVPPASRWMSSPSTTMRASCCHAPVDHRRDRVDELRVSSPSPVVAEPARGSRAPASSLRVAADADVDERRVGPERRDDAALARGRRGRPRRAPPAPSRIACLACSRTAAASGSLDDGRGRASRARRARAGRARATPAPRPWCGSRTRCRGTGRSGGRSGRPRPRSRRGRRPVRMQLERPRSWPGARRAGPCRRRARRGCRTRGRGRTAAARRVDLVDARRHGVEVVLDEEARAAASRPRRGSSSRAPSRCCSAPSPK